MVRKRSQKAEEAIADVKAGVEQIAEVSALRVRLEAIAHEIMAIADRPENADVGIILCVHKDGGRTISARTCPTELVRLSVLCVQQAACCIEAGDDLP